jgi:hypothetical protein
LEDLGFLICKPCGELKKNKVKKEEEEKAFCAVFSNSNEQKKRLFNLTP